MTDTGPPYPPPPRRGTNAIGLFSIGTSQIGEIVPDFDVWSTIISQYGNSPVLTALILNFRDNVDVSVLFDSFYDHIWNIATAEGYGLDIWGRIVGINRLIAVQNARWLGFEQQDGTTDPYNTSPYYGGERLTDNFRLNDESYRLLILAKAASNITSGAAPSINRILLSLFPGRGNCFVTDEGGMYMTYQFNFFLSGVEKAIIRSSGVLPKTTGVRVGYFMFGSPF